MVARSSTLYVLIGEGVSEFLLSAVVIKLLSVAEKVLNHVVLLLYNDLILLSPALMNKLDFKEQRKRIIL